MLEKTLESPLDCKEIQPVHPKGDQSWVFIGRTDAEAETPILWLPHVKSWLIGKDPDAGRDWEQEKKGKTEDETAGWHHWLYGHEFGWTPGVGDGQGGLACCNSQGHKESDMTGWLNWTEYSTVHIHHNFFMHSSGDGHLGCFHVVAVVKSAAMKLCNIPKHHRRCWHHEQCREDMHGLEVPIWLVLPSRVDGSRDPCTDPFQEIPEVFSESNTGKRDSYWRTGVHGPLQRKMIALLDLDSHLENGLLKSGNWGPSILSIKAVKIASISWIEEGGLSLPPSWYFSLTCKRWWTLFGLRFLALASQQETNVLDNGVILDCGCNTWSGVNFNFILYLSTEELVGMTKIAWILLWRTLRIMYWSYCSCKQLVRIFLFSPGLKALEGVPSTTVPINAWEHSFIFI